MARILLTGANGYVGTRLLTLLGEANHQIIALVRSRRRLAIPPHLADQVTVVEADLLNRASLESIPKEVDVAFYLVHSMGLKSTGFAKPEAEAAENFANFIKRTTCKQVIYLSGLARGDQLSEHMRSRHSVEETLRAGHIPLTVFRAGIIIGSGSASFEILRDLVEKLPLMVAPRWVHSRCQPIGISDVLFYLMHSVMNEKCYDRTFEIGGPQVLTYCEMLRRFAALRGLRRWILSVPVLTPRLSSYWLLLVTSTNFPLAQALVDSLKHDAVCEDKTVSVILPHDCLTYEQALSEAFDKIEQNAVLSSWKDAIVCSDLEPGLLEYVTIPTHGCIKELVSCSYTNREQLLDKIWQIGGKNGWYYMNWAWVVRGWCDKLVGGVGLRRGRRSATALKEGDALDFWRVLFADREKGRLLLYAEMKVPGEAWLEFECVGNENEGQLRQTATFRPRGLLGRLYWYLLYPVHHLIFRGLCRALTTTCQ